MSQILKPPNSIPAANGSINVFLAGSIEMGTAQPWQTLVEQRVADLDMTILNQRRDEWDSSWVQSIDNPSFREQVEWELSAQEQATMIAMYFDPSTRAPITLLELGLFGRTGKLIVCCPEGYWRKGNVDVVCRRYGIEQVESLEDLIKRIRDRLGSRV